MTPRPGMVETCTRWHAAGREQGHAEGLIACAATHAELRRRARARAIFELDRGTSRAFRAGERQGVVRALVAVLALLVGAVVLGRKR